MALVLNVLADRGDDFAAGIAKADTKVRIGVGNNVSETFAQLDKLLVTLCASVAHL